MYEKASKKSENGLYKKQSKQNDLYKTSKKSKAAFTKQKQSTSNIQWKEKL